VKYSTDIRCSFFYIQVVINHANRRTSMNIRTSIAIATTALVMLTATGCAVQRGQETMGAYVDDTGITTLVKSRFVENKQVDASAISVETMKGTVMLSGFAKNATEKSTAETIAWGVNGVKAVKNSITVRP
jgi:hyperosmotically inducible periplasmic protein